MGFHASVRNRSFDGTEDTLFAAGGRLVAMGNQAGNFPGAVLLPSHDDHQFAAVLNRLATGLVLGTISKCRIYPLMNGDALVLTPLN